MNATRQRAAAAALLWFLSVAAGVHAAPTPGPASHANPFAYAGEYRDPTWGGTYLRARWYHPALTSFLGRDSALRQLGHYGYAGGNPLMRSDPSGMSYERAIGGGLGRGLRWMNAGIGGHFARLFLGQFLVPLQIVADPGGFWHQLRHDTGGVTAFLAAGIAVELAAYGAMGSAMVRTATTRSGEKLFWARLGAETAIGVGQSATASFSGGFRHFHGRTLLQGLESILGPESVYRVAIGIGYQPFNLTQRDIRSLVSARLGSGTDEVLVFRVREDNVTSRSGSSKPLSHTWTSPWQNRADLGLFHASLVAINGAEWTSTEFFDGILTRQDQYAAYDVQFWYRENAVRPRWEYVGKFDRAAATKAMLGNPLNLPTHEEIIRYRLDGTRAPDRVGYSTLRRNCQTHVGLIIRELQGG